MELLVVVAVVLILIAIALPRLQDAIVRSRVAKASADTRNLLTALESYMLDWRVYPPDHDPDWAVTGAGSNGFTLLTTPIAYLAHWPLDPFGTSVRGTPFQRTGRTYSGGSGSDNPACGGRAHYGDASYLAHGKSCGHAYAVSSLGPDRTPSILGLREFPSGSPDFTYPCVFTTFSPTNGTGSIGDIFAFVGDWGRRTVQIDGVTLGG